MARVRLEFRDVTKRFPAQKRGAPPVIAVEQVSFAIEDGEVVSIIGPSGCGKSTLLNMGAGLDPTSLGDVFVDGERVEWEKGDLVLLPLREKGVEHQHFNSDTPDKPALWMAFIHGPTRDYVASEMTQSEVSPEYKAAEEKGGR